jgi:hypothetical protein
MAISRGLTDDERDMLRSVYGSGITYSAVKIHNEKWHFFQPDDTAMTPNGQMYWPPAHYKADFSKEALDIRAWFVHEGAHLYQHYGLHWNVIARGIVSRNYNYTLVASKAYSAYGLEEMGDIASDFYTLRHHGSIAPRTYVLSDYATLLPTR